MICCQLVEWTLFLSFFLDSGIYNYIMDHLVSVKLNLVVNTLEWLLKAWSDIATCWLGGIHRLWLEQKAFREGGHITSLRRDCGENRRHGGRRVTSLGRDWSVTRIEDTQGYSHLWTSFGLWGREVSSISGLIFGIEVEFFVSSVREGVKKADILRSGWA